VKYEIFEILKIDTDWVYYLLKNCNSTVSPGNNIPTEILVDIQENWIIHIIKIILSHVDDRRKK